MPLAVEGGNGADPLANGYISVADVDAYFLERNKAAWTGDNAAKEAAIIAGCQYLDSVYQWKGERCSDEQPLEWPRYLYPDDARFRNSDLDTPELPLRVKQANAELALLALSGDLLPAATGPRVTSENVSVAGAISRARTFHGRGGFSNQRHFPFVDAMVSKYTKGGGGVRSARVERA